MRTLISLSILVFFNSAFCPAQLNKVSPMYVSAIGAISASYQSPYAIPKRVDHNKEAFEEVADQRYKTTRYLDAQVAVFENNGKRHKAYQLISIHPQFTPLCEHYIVEPCDWF